MIRAFSIAVIALSSVLQTGAVVGLIEDLSGAVFFKASPDAAAVPLDGRRDIVRLLYAGQQLQCTTGATLKIRIEDTPRDIKCPSAWIALTPSSTDRSRTLQSVLSAYGRPGGRSRGPEGRIVVPADEGVVMPSTFVIRWSESPATPTVNASIAEFGGRTIWRQDNIPGAPGVLVSTSAREALINYRKTAGNGRLVLRLADSSREQAQAVFSLLSMQAEQTLQQELASWSKERALLIRHLLRAMSYAKARLPVEETEEYEAALREAPESQDLINRTMVANSSIGNGARAAELAKLLAGGGPGLR